MNNDIQETPRIHGAFPATPQNPRPRPLSRPFGDFRRRTGLSNGLGSTTAPTTTTATATGTTTATSGAGGGGTTVPPAVVQPAPGGPEPWIPTTLIDTPTQRLYAITIFVGLQAYKLYDLSKLWTDEEDMTTLYFCMKWWGIDSFFFYNLPNFRIPWLHFNATFTFYLIMGFMFLDLVMPHFSSAPFTALFTGLWKLIYDRELSISERRVKWSDVIHNDTHIMGKYTVHILPEGIAKLNPHGGCYCLGQFASSVTVPIKINGTSPISIKLQRVDLDTSNVETIELSQKEIKKLINKSPREESPELKFLPYTIKQPGLYRLVKVKDVTELDVRIHQSYALVVSCPKARIQAAPGRHKDVCRHDMSDLTIQLEGLAPLSVTYSRVVKGKATTLSVGRIHPENFDSPLLSGFSLEGHLAEKDYTDLSTWAKSQSLAVPLNDSLTSSGDWLYEIDQVVDGCGNSVDYKIHQEEGDSWMPKVKDLTHKLVVHERPIVRFQGCDPQHPLEVPRGTRGVLPLKLEAAGSSPPYRLKVAFTPQDKLGSATEHAPDAEIQEFTYKSPSDLMTIRGPGLYSIRQISSAHCSGEIFEPSSCLVVTPPEPTMTMEFDEILDKCTKSSVGLNIDLTLVGSPPFRLSYRLIKDNGPPEIKTLRIDRARHQERFTPEDPGHYTYEFFRLDDKNYEGVKIDPASHRVEQDVKPTASAHFINQLAPKTVCIDEPVEFKIKMVGEGPWNLHYDLIHSGKRVRYTEKNINTTIHTIKTPSLSMGGEHSLALTSVEDRNGCKGFLESEAKINVRFQRPKAQFSPIEGKMAIRALEGKTIKIPLRLTGEGPWYLKIRNMDQDAAAKEFRFDNPNTYFPVNEVGTYHIEEVRDSGCPGIVSSPNDKFTVTMIERPKVRLPPSSAIVKQDNTFVRNAVCEGDEDAVELAFVGQPPFTVYYEKIFRPEGAPKRHVESSENQLSAGQSTLPVRLETSKAGVHEYIFNRLADGLYNDPRDKNMPDKITLQQTVYPRPSITFLNPKKVYKYCLDSAAGEDSIIPIQLTGLPPFAITVHIKHHNTGKKDIVHVPLIESNYYEFQIPPHYLTLGDHTVTVHKVKDGRGCSRRMDESTSEQVTVAVADMPTIAPSEQRVDYCVGERIAFTLAGLPPFAVEYNWNGETMLATNQPSSFVRVAERPGNFTITGLQDSASDCKVALDLHRIIHEVPSVRISEGTTVVKGIPQGDQAEIVFRFYGTPPFTFTYTRSAIAKKGQKPRVLESHTRTADDFTYVMFATQEGTYEVTSIEDRFCSYPPSSVRKSV